MRKLIAAAASTNATATALLPSFPPPPPPLSPEPLSTPSNGSDLNDMYKHAMLFFPRVPFMDSVFDLANITVIFGLLLLSLVSISLILHLRLKSRKSHHLRHFSSFWTVRFLLVSLVILWALNEILRLNFFRRRYLFPFLPSLTLSQEANLCKIHVVLSLGLFEPGFLITLLYLVNMSTKKRNPHDMWAIVYVFVTCLPIVVVETISVFFSPSEINQLPDIFRRSFVLSEDKFGNKTVLCTYPLLNTIAFAAFGIAYALWFMLSCWRVLSIVINKGIRFRIQILCSAVMVSLPLQIVLLGLSTLWRPKNVAYGGDMLAMCLSVTLCAAVGQGILVIKPIAEALSAGGDCCRWDAGDLAKPDGDGQGVSAGSQ